MYLLVSERDYCEAPCTDRVPNVSAKKVPLYPKVPLAPLPPRNEKFADLEALHQVGLQISKCHFTPTKVKSQQI